MFVIKLKKHIVEISHEIIVTILMLAFAIAYHFQTIGLSFQSMLFPRILFAGIAVTTVFTIKKSIKIKVADESEAASEMGINKSEKIECSIISKKMALFIVSVFSLIFCLPKLGANLSIILFLLVTMLVLNVRNKLLLVLVPICTDLFIFGIFKLWLKVPLPTGMLGF